MAVMADAFRDRQQCYPGHPVSTAKRNKVNSKSLPKESNKKLGIAEIGDMPDFQTMENIRVHYQ